ncbi:MAG: Thiosulfate sulfurtransferase PspE [Flavobacteriales bacterium UBA4585]|nr:MAG: Thiosulfate sulfurtransferase PspE [Flavobacteriales bacterium UBA4585]
MGLLSFLFGGSKKQDRIIEALQAGAKIVDVRTPGEFRQGHAKGAVNIPLGNLAQKTAQLQKENQPIILCCRSGARASNAASILQGVGIQSINAGAWQTVAKLQ